MKNMNEKKSSVLNHHIQASTDFNKARNRALWSKIQNIMNAERDDLLSFHDVKEILKPKNQIYMGMKSIPLNLIVGSEGRYRDFNKNFQPKSEFLRARWESIDRAQLRDIILPAIQLYEIGGVYFVRDGNHRVSVARTQGIEEIDAEVIGLASEIALKPSMTVNDLKRSVINLEKKIFYEKTGYGDLTGDNDLMFTATGRFDKIYEHILAHKYYTNLETEKEIPFPDALKSWYTEIYKPIIDIIKNEKLLVYFPDRSQSDLYLWIVRHWDFLKRKYGDHYSVSEAARIFSRRYGNRKKSFFGIFCGFLGSVFGRFFNRQGIGNLQALVICKHW